MRVSVRSCRRGASLLLLLLANPLRVDGALADPVGVYLPAPPTGPGGEDSIETSGGTRCRQSINSNGSYLDVGVTGTASGPPASQTPAAIITSEHDQSATAYARVTIPLGHKPKRIDCDQVYQLEIAKLKREVELLKMAAQ